MSAYSAARIGLPGMVISENTIPAISRIDRTLDGEIASCFRLRKANSRSPIIFRCFGDPTAGIPTLAVSVGDTPDNRKAVNTFATLNIQENAVLVDWQQPFIPENMASNGIIEIWWLG